MFLNIYAIAALGLIAANIVVTSMAMPPELTSQDAQYVVYAIEGLGFPWPVVVLSLINTQGARNACARKQPPLPRASMS